MITHEMKANHWAKFVRWCIWSSFFVLFMGCATPSVSTQGIINPDQDPLGGGISSGDVRTLASRLAPELLGLPEISENSDLTRIAISPMRNSSRFIIDNDLFMKRLRLELNRYGNQRVRFFSQGQSQAVRREVLGGREDAELQKSLELLGREIGGLSLVRDAEVPPTFAVLPVLNSNFVNMNADSIVAMLRSHVVSGSQGKLSFLLPGTLEGADYILTGQFIAESLKTEGIVNLTNYIQIVDERLKEGKSLNVYDDLEAGGQTVSNVNGTQVVIAAGGEQRASLLEKIALNQRLQTPPNVTKYLNVMVADAKTKATVYEKMFAIEKKVTEGLGRADYILAGEINGLSKSVQGQKSDYLLITVQLVDPESNEIVWEDGYEIKKQSRAGIVYQ